MTQKKTNTGTGRKSESSPMRSGRSGSEKQGSASMSGKKSSTKTSGTKEKNR